MPGPGEFEIIRNYFAGAPKGTGVELGIGDDCALLRAPREGLLATSVDTLVAGVHFPADADPAKIATRALRVNLSDLAAMNAQPLWFTLALTLPESDASWLQQFADGLLETAGDYGVSLVGGDTTRGPLTITIQVTGSCCTALRRDSAMPGDTIFVSGELGAAAAALPVVLGKRKVNDVLAESARRVYFTPRPRFDIAAAVGGLASSALDISDGLVADLGHICRASNVGAELKMEAVPVAELAQQLAGDAALELAASGGDDYQLCFTVPQKHLPELESLGLDVVAIGTITAGTDEVHCEYRGRPWRATRAGYRHF